jgi:hypothetical protein
MPIAALPSLNIAQRRVGYCSSGHANHALARYRELGRQQRAGESNGERFHNRSEAFRSHVRLLQNLMSHRTRGGSRGDRFPY